MPIAQSIRQRGFRKWYERELLVGHGHLVLLLMCTLALLAGMEAFSQPAPRRALIATCVLAAAGIGLWALRRYLFLLTRAELIAHQAVCPQCQVYARWKVDDTAPARQRTDDAGDEGEDGEGGEGHSMRVCCRACGGRWRIDW